MNDKSVPRFSVAEVVSQYKLIIYPRSTFILTLGFPHQQLGFLSILDNERSKSCLLQADK